MTMKDKLIEKQYSSLKQAEAIFKFAKASPDNRKFWHACIRLFEDEIKELAINLKSMLANRITNFHELYDLMITPGWTPDPDDYLSLITFSIVEKNAYYSTYFPEIVADDDRVPGYKVLTTIEFVKHSEECDQIRIEAFSTEEGTAKDLKHVIASGWLKAFSNSELLLGTPYEDTSEEEMTYDGYSSFIDRAIDHEEGFDCLILTCNLDPESTSLESVAEVLTPLVEIMHPVNHSPEIQQTALH